MPDISIQAVLKTNNEWIIGETLDSHVSFNLHCETLTYFLFLTLSEAANMDGKKNNFKRGNLNPMNPSPTQQWTMDFYGKKTIVHQDNHLSSQTIVRPVGQSSIQTTIHRDNSDPDNRSKDICLEGHLSRTQISRSLCEKKNLLNNRILYVYFSPRPRCCQLFLVI